MANHGAGSDEGEASSMMLKHQVAVFRPVQYTGDVAGDCVVDLSYQRRSEGAIKEGAVIARKKARTQFGEEAVREVVQMRFHNVRQVLEPHSTDVKRRTVGRSAVCPHVSSLRGALQKRCGHCLILQRVELRRGLRRAACSHATQTRFV